MLKNHEKLGIIVIVTLKGDLRDIGKNLVLMMLKDQGFDFENLDVSIPAKSLLNV